MKYKNINKEDGKRILSFYKNGKSIKYINTIMNVSPPTIYNFLKKNNIQIRKPKYFIITENQEKKIISMYCKKYKCIDIAKKFGISQSGVYYILNKNEIKRKKNDTKYTLNEHYLDKIDTKEKAYILGLLFADGCNTNDRISIGLIEEDKNLLLKINELFGSNRPLYKINPKKRTHKVMYLLSVSSVHLCKMATQHGVCKSKTLKLEFPKNLNKTLYSDFIRGYFDGDGCIYFNNNIKNFSWSIVGTVNFCNSIKNILEKKLNIHCGIYTDKKLHHNIKYVMVCGNTQVNKLMNFLYSDATIWMHRKKNKYLNNFKCIGGIKNKNIHFKNI